MDLDENYLNLFEKIDYGIAIFENEDLVFTNNFLGIILGLDILK